MDLIKTIRVASVIVLALIFAFAAFAYASSFKTPPPLQPIETSHFIGKAENILTSELGAPNHEVTYTMDECVGELRVTLFNTYSPDRTDLAEIEIRELTWGLPDNKFTAWLHRPNGKWIILETFRYQTEGVF